MHIGIVIPFFAKCHGYGGAERIGACLANAMCKRGVMVTVFARQSKTMELMYPLESAINICWYSHQDTHSNISALRTDLKRRGLDVCVVMDSYASQLFWAVTLLGTGIPYVYSEHNCPQRVEEHWSRAGRLAAMSGADVIHLLLESYKESLPAFLQGRAVCIPNPEPAFQFAMPPVPVAEREPILCSLGRLCEVKQLPLLIEAFGLIHARFPEWKLEIWGDGPDEKKLRSLVSASPARERIRLCGGTSDVAAALGRASVFVIPSRHEGLPNSVLEAMACATPVVGFAGCPGVNSVVVNGKNGLLAPSMTSASLAEALAGIMQDASLRDDLSKNCPALLQEYRPERVCGLWEEALYAAASRKGATQMDAFSQEPFASMARLSAMARREFLFRDFGEPWPGTIAWGLKGLRKRLERFVRQVKATVPFFKGS